MSRATVSTDKAPAAIGPYSQAVRAGGMVFVSGMLGIDPRSGNLVAGGVEHEARQALRNLAAVLEAAGSSVDKVVRTTVLLADIGDYAQVNAVYGETFRKDPPARAAFQVAALPKGGRVEITCVAQT